jgi:16S rRNA (adenine(1408)-N(1))-methyltransferase
VRRARANPQELVIGVDADARAMGDASRRAAASARRGGLANAIFIAAAAEQLPGPLAALADEITIALPWGSLLRGLLSVDAQLTAGIAQTLRPGGLLTILISATDRDGAADGYVLESDDDARDFATRLACAGLHVVGCRRADRSDVETLSSAWGKKLGIPDRRPAWLFAARQTGPGSSSRPL